jgi:hypothetical protein
MKYIKYILLTIFIIPINIKAYEFVCPTGPHTYPNTFTCNIVGEYNKTYDELSGSIDPKSISNISCKVSGYADGLTVKNKSDEYGFSLTGTPTSENLVTYTCEVTTQSETSTSASIIMDNFKYHFLDDNRDAFTEVLRSPLIQIAAYHEEAPVVVDTKPRRTDNPDSRLKLISDENLDFVFSQFKTQYDLSVLFEVEELNLHIVPNNENSTYRIEGSQKLAIGLNVIDIYVTALDGTETCYTLNVTRLKRGEEIYYPEKDASLKSLSINGFDINFEPVIYDYNIHATYDINYLTVNAVATNDEANIVITSTDNIKNGDTVKITVTSKDGSNSMVYMIHVQKDAPPRDYKPLIFGGLITLAIALVILLIIKTNQKNKNDPLLRIKGDKTKVNYGKKLDTNQIPDAGSGVNIEGSINTIDLNNTAKPIETEEVLDMYKNKKTSVVTTLDLSNAAVPQPVQQQSVPVQQPVQPVEMAQPVQPVQPVVQPVEMPQPVQPIQQVPMQQPVQPVQPVAQPVEMPQPVQQTPNVVTQEPPKDTNIFD